MAGRKATDILDRGPTAIQMRVAAERRGVATQESRGRARAPGEVGGQPPFVTSRHCEAIGQRFTTQRLGATGQPAANPLVVSRGMSRTVSGPDRSGSGENQLSRGASRTESGPIARAAGQTSVQK